MSNNKGPWQEDKQPEKNTLIESLKPGLNSVLGVRDSIGAKIRDVFILTRTWGGAQIGVGDYVDKLDQVKPSPQLVDYSHSVFVHEGGAVRSGDIIIKGISKSSYPAEEDIDCRVDQHRLNVQKFYFINNLMYNVIHVKDNYLTWEVHVRKLDSEQSKVASQK